MYMYMLYIYTLADHDALFKINAAFGFIQCTADESMALTNSCTNRMRAIEAENGRVERSRVNARKAEAACNLCVRAAICAAAPTVFGHEAL